LNKYIPKIRTSLALQFWINASISLILAVTLFLSLQKGLNYLADNRANDEQVQLKQEQMTIDKFQNFVTENHLDINNRDAFYQWVQKEKYILLTLSLDGVLVFNSNISDLSMYIDNNIDISDLYIYEDSTDLEWYLSSSPYKKSYEIIFSNQQPQQSITAQIYCFYELKYYYLIHIVSAVAAFSLFTAIILFSIYRKTKYITLIESDLKELSEGDLTHQMNIKGEDELARLARGIDEMRHAILEQQRLEKQARRANNELITAMSHDLRTPLTSMIGYLDIIEFKKYENEAQMLTYTHTIREKAYQIKELSDKLFEYFLVYGTDANTIDLQTVNSMEFLLQTLDEELFLLESQGFIIEKNAPDIQCMINLDTGLIRRLFDNIISNIKKYADEKYPISVIYRLSDNMLKIEVKNRIKSDNMFTESNGIGLKTCLKIANKHNGSFQHTVSSQFFIILLSLPVFLE